jgi:hypothetical protein
MDDDASTGEGTGRQGPWKRVGKHPREGLGGDVHHLDVENDPRGGSQSDGYRTADPRDLVIEGDTAMMGPGGHPVEERDPEVREDEGDDVPSEP